VTARDLRKLAGIGIGAAARMRFAQIAARKTPDAILGAIWKKGAAKALEWIKRLRDMRRLPK
jgi:hypothetical protein